MRIICSAPRNMCSDKLIEEIEALGIRAIISHTHIKAVCEVSKEDDPIGTALVLAFEKEDRHKVDVHDQTPICLPKEVVRP